MLAQRADTPDHFTRRDASRLFIFSLLLVIAMSAILGVDIVPARAELVVGEPAPGDVRAPRTEQYTSDVATDAERERARAAVPFQYDYTTVTGQHYVVRLDILVNNITFQRVFQCRCDLTDNLHCLKLRQSFFGLQDIAEKHAIDKLADNGRPFVENDQVVNLSDGRMLEALS